MAKKWFFILLAQSIVLVQAGARGEDICNYYHDSDDYQQSFRKTVTKGAQKSIETDAVNDVSQSSSLRVSLVKEQFATFSPCAHQVMENVLPLMNDFFQLKNDCIGNGCPHAVSLKKDLNDYVFLIYESKKENLNDHIIPFKEIIFQFLDFSKNNAKTWVGSGAPYHNVLSQLSVLCSLFVLKTDSYVCCHGEHIKKKTHIKKLVVPTKSVLRSLVHMMNINNVTFIIFLIDLFAIIHYVYDRRYWHIKALA